MAESIEQAKLSLRTLINPTPKQELFIKAFDEHEYTLYGGAAGGGKSRILRWNAVRRLFKFALERNLRNVRVGLFSEDYPALHERHLSKVRFEFPEELGKMHEQTHEFRLHERHGGGVLAFRNLDDPSKYMSSEFADIYVDELTRNDRETFDQLNSRRRWVGVHDTKFAGATNPGQKGHAWVKKLWITRDFTDETFTPEQFAFVPAFVTDNPHVSPTYMRTLESLPTALRRALLEGDWDIFEGQYFMSFRRSLHVIDPMEIPEDWLRWTAIDYGTAAPFCCLWFAQDPTTGRRYVYRELYRKGWVARTQARRILTLSANESIAYNVGDPSMFNKTSADGTSPEDAYREEGLMLRRGYNDRVPGWHNVLAALEVQPDGIPGIQFFSTCENLIRTLPEQIHSEFDPEDIDTDMEDHAVDALRYGVSHTSTAARARRRRRKAGYLQAVS